MPPVCFSRSCTIAIVLILLQHLFQPNDYRDHRFFQKRAYYLACLAAGIQNAKSPTFALSFAYQDDNILQPILLVEPSQGAISKQAHRKPPADICLDGSADHPAKSKCVIRVILAASGELFPLEKTQPTKTCIRNRGADVRVADPTPMHNATLRSECCSLASLKQLHRSLVQSPAFRDACMLGAVWLRQRGLGSSITSGGFGQFEWSSTISILMRTGGPADRPAMSTGYSSYQLFKATLQFLSTADLISKPLVLQSTNFRVMNNDGPVLFDGARGLNILFKMSAWSYRRVSSSHFS